MRRRNDANENGHSGSARFYKSYVSNVHFCTTSRAAYGLLEMRLFLEELNEFL